MTVKEINSIPFVFIVGMGRSGTTLLRTIMDAGEETIFPIESKIIVFLKQKYHHKKNWSIELLDEFLVDLYKEIKFVRGWKVNEVELRSKFLEYPIHEISFSFLIRLIYLTFQSHFSKTGIKLIGDKNPVYCIFISELMEVFPSAKFIHIVREYHDCILSNKKLFKQKNVSALAQMWKMYNSWIEIHARNRPEIFYRIRYEDLTSSPEKMVRELCAFTGLNYNERMLDFHLKLNEKLDKDLNIIVQHTHPKLLNAISSDSVGKGKMELSENELEQIAYILSEYGTKYGYQKYENYSGKKYRWKTFKGFVLNIIDIFIIKGYFLTPFAIRNLIRKTSTFLYEKLGYYTVYSHEDFLYDLAKSKRKEADEAKNK